jgi:hypothetical protein
LLWLSIDRGTGTGIAQKDAVLLLVGKPKNSH